MSARQSSSSVRFRLPALLMALAAAIGVVISVATVLFPLPQPFAIVVTGLLLAAVGLGAGLHALITRRHAEAAFRAGEQGVVDRRRTDSELRRVNRALRTISHCGQAMVHATDEQSLLDQLCRIIVTDGGYRMAWVALVDRSPQRRIQPAARAGVDDGYVEAIAARWADPRRELGASREALRDGHRVVCRDYETDPNAAAWRHEALARGYRSSASIPLMSSGRAFGAILIYSAEPDAFDDEELALLEELASDLAYGIQALRLRARHLRAEQALEATERLLRQLIRHTPAAVAMLDRDMRYIEASDRWLSDYHLHGREIVGRSHYEVFPDTPERWKAIHQRVLAGAVERCDEDSFPRADGRVGWLAWEVRPWHQSDGSIGGLTMFTQNITERKRAEHALRESQAKLVIAMDMARLAPWEFDRQTGQFVFNDTFYALLRTSAAAEGGYAMSVEDYTRRFVPPDEADLVRRHIEKARTTADPRHSQRFEHRVRRGDGSIGTVLVRFAIVKDETGRTTGAHGVNQDITERREREEALRISEERFRSAMSHSPIGMAIVAPDGRFTEVNPALCAIVGYPREELILTQFEALTHPDDQALDLACLRQLVDHEVEVYQIEKRYLHKDGHIVWAQANVSLVRDEEQRPRYFVKQVQDITERKRAAAEMEALNARHARHEAAMARLTRSQVPNPGQFTDVLQSMTEVVGGTLEVAHAGVWRPNPALTSLTCADQFEWPSERHVSGMVMSGAEVEGYVRALAAADMITATDAARDPRTAAIFSTHLSALGLTSVLDVPIRAHGAMVGVLRCGQVGPPRKWAPDEQTFAVAVANLLSSLFAQVERQRLEEQLRQSQKLEGIGQLAGGVAHDFNNALTVILGKAGQLSDDARLPATLRQAADDITQSGRRAANLTRQLLAFSRQQAMQVKDVDLNVAIRSVARMLEPILGEDLTLRCSLAEEPVLVRADAGMIDQVVLNLAVNARDAMRRGGQLVIEVSLVDIDAQTAARHGCPGGRYACLSVRDSGSGITPEALPHIFEPFFTTKAVGKGTGLGLATTYGIVQQHDGWIEVESALGQGSTFRVFLPQLMQPRPAAAGGPAAGPATAAPAVGAPAERVSILVAEDEDAVRSLVVEALSGIGYHVLEAASGPRALDVWREQGSAIDLLITDIVMPDGMNGLELASEIKRANPALRIIYISGYLADVSQEDLLRSAGATYLAKPFSLSALAQLVRQSLDAA